MLNTLSPRVVRLGRTNNAIAELRSQSAVGGLPVGRCGAFFRRMRFPYRDAGWSVAASEHNGLGFDTRHLTCSSLSFRPITGRSAERMARRCTTM
jgi:hypothetical protein